MNIVLNFLTGFILKYFTTAAIEKIVLILLKNLADNTKSKICKDMYEAVFEKVNN